MDRSSASGGHNSPSSASINSSQFAAATAAVGSDRSAKKLRKLAEDSFSFVSEQKKHVIKGKNHHQQIITKYRQNVEQDLKNTKQQIIRHVLYSRALERAKTQIEIVQDALHSHLIEKSDPMLWTTIQTRKVALKQDFGLPLEESVITRLNGRIGWIYPGMIGVLLESLNNYQDNDFVNALESIPIAPTQINLDLYIKIANRTTKGLISDLEASSLFAIVQEKVPIIDGQKNESSAGQSATEVDGYQRRWSMLKNFLRKKIFRLYLARKAHEYICEMEEKLKQKSGFYFPNASTTVSIGNSNLLSSSMSLASIASSEPATLLDSATSPNKSLLSKSLTSLPSLEIAPSVNHTVASKSKIKGTQNNKITTYGAPPKKEKLSLREKLQQELNASMAKQNELQGKITADLAKLYQEGINLAPPSTAVTVNTSTRPASSPSIASNSVSVNASDSVISQTTNKLQSPAVAQYFKQTAIQKLITAMEKYVRNILILRIRHWKKVTNAKDLEWKCCLFSQNVACARLLRIVTWNYLRRLSNAWEQMKRFVRIFEEREKFAASVDIQRHYRGYKARCAAKRIIEHNAAVTIQAAMRVFLANQRVRKLKYYLKLKRSVRIIENLWKKNIWKRALKKAFDHHRKQRANLLIQRIYRGHKGRQRFAKILLKKMKRIAAIKFQCLWRRYRAVIRVEKLRVLRKRRRAATMIQAMVRGKFTRKRFEVKWDRHCKAKVIQYAWLCCKARKETTKRRRKKSAILIQRVVRGMLARHRVKKLIAQRQAAIEVIEPVGRGYIARRRIKERMEQHLARRSQAARKIQILLKALVLGMQARKRVAGIKVHEHHTRLRLRASITIQRVARGMLGRIRVKELRQALASQAKGGAVGEQHSRSLPYYYRLKASYWQEQNFYHRKYAIKVQSFIRRFLAKRRVHKIRVEKSVKKIQVFYKGAKLIEEAKEVRRALTAQAVKRKSMQLVSVANIQRLARGFIARRRVGKIKAAETIKWAIWEIRVIIKTKKAVENFRTRKIEQECRRVAVIKIQALMRGVLQRRRYKKSYRSLVRQRALRIRAKKEKAAVVIQCAYRCYRAKKRVAQQRIVFGEKVKEREEMAALEKSIEGMHEDWMQQLLAIRAQTGIRGMLARNEFVKKVQEYKELQAQLQKKKIHDAAAKIQALARGVIGRKRFKKNLPALKKALKMKSYCVECEAKVATRRCRSCKDKYCADCYDIIHQKGNRKLHSWENIKLDARIMALIYEESKAAAGGGNSSNNNKKGNPKDWEEHYDHAAKAKYWFNKKTGEASWISPFA